MGGVYDGPTWTKVDPRLQSAFMQLQAAAPGRVELGNGWRSNAQQAALKRQKPNLAAEPGKSNHEFGLALDITYENAATRRWVHENAARFGLWFPMDYEPWHVQLMGIDRHNVGNPNAQIGGGRFAFPQAPDGRFANPYDALQGTMDQEDPYDPMTQFSRLVGAMNSPAGMQAPTGIASPDFEEGSKETEDVAGQLQQGMAADPLNQAFPGDMAGAGATDHTH